MTDMLDSMKGPQADSDATPLCAGSGWVGAGFGLRRGR